MIKTKLFSHVISPTEDTLMKVDEQINEWIKETSHEILNVDLTSNVVGEEGREIVRAMVMYKENEELPKKEKVDAEEADENSKTVNDEDDTTGGYVDDL